MAENNIGKASLLLSADGAKLNSDLSKASSSITSFCSGLKAKMEMALGPIGLIMKVIGGVSGAFGFASAQVKELGKHLDQIADTSKIASRLGVPMSQFSGLMGAAKLNAEQLSGALQNVAQLSSRASMAGGGRGAGAASPGGGRAQRAFQQLALDPGELRLQSAEAQFRTIGEAISKISSPMEQVRIATQLFGQEGAKIAGAFRGGFGNAMEEAKRLGLVISDEDAATAMRMQKNWKQIGRVIDGAWKMAAAAAAPFFEIVSEVMVGIYEFIQPIWKNIADVIRAFANYFKAYFAELKSTFGEFWAYAKDFWGSWSVDIGRVQTFVVRFVRSCATTLGFLADQLLHLGAAFGDWVVVPIIRGGASLMLMFSSLMDRIRQGFILPLLSQFQRIVTAVRGLARLDPTGALTGALNIAERGIRLAQDRSGDGAAALRTGAANLQGMARSLIAANQGIRNMANIQNGVDQFFQRVENRMRNGVQAVARELQGIDPILQQRAAQLADRFKEPIEELNKSLAELGELFDNGLIDSVVLGKAMEEALKKAESGLHIKPDQFSSVAFAGSKDAIKEIYHRNENKPLEVQERIRQIQERQLRVQELSQRNGEIMLDILRQREDSVVFI